MASAQLTEMIPPPEGGRVFVQSARAGLADCAPSGRTRLDAVARWLQDVAYADVEDAGVADHAVWVVRRARIRVDRFPRFGERFQLSTFCSGMGVMWAERRTTIAVVDGDGQAPCVEAVSLWVHLDPETRRPTPFTEREIAVYGGTAGDRRIRARLRHPRPSPGADTSRTWCFRAAELDLAGHINNTAYWQPLEEALLTGPGPDPERLDAEIEFRTPAQPGCKTVLSDGLHLWIVDQDGEVHASVLAST